MARPIKETPLLTGKDAKRFLDDRKNNLGKKEDDQTRERIMANYKRFSITTHGVRS